MISGKQGRLIKGKKSADVKGSGEESGPLRNEKYRNLPEANDHPATAFTKDSISIFI